MWERLNNWLEVWMGVDDLIRSQVSEYRVPKNINIFYTFGFVAAVGYLILVLSGIMLLIYYVPHPDHAFRSVQDIMLKVPYGWLFRQMHVMGSNLMIAAIGLHMLTVFVMGNYKRPRELTWIGGALLLFVTIAFGFSGYLLPRFSGSVHAPILRRVDTFLRQALPKAYGEREQRAEMVATADTLLTDVVGRLKRRGIVHPYVKNFVMARVNPLTRARKTVPSFEQALAKVHAALEAFDVDTIRNEDIARAAVGTPT